MKTYKLAIDKQHGLVSFGPLLTLQEAEHWRGVMAEAGKECLVINVGAV